MFGFEKKSDSATLSPMALGMLSGYLSMFNAMVNNDQFIKEVNGEKVYDAKAQIKAIVSAPSEGLALGFALEEAMRNRTHEVAEAETCSKDTCIGVGD